MKILLIEPFQSPEERWGTFKHAKGYFPPLGLISIRNYLVSKNWDVYFFDTQFGDTSENDLKKFLISERFDVVGISAMTNNVTAAYKTATFCKKILPDIKTVIGGAHASILPDKTLRECPDVDFLVAGEGEITLDELLTALKIKSDQFHKIDGLFWRKNGKPAGNRMRKFITNLDMLPEDFYKNINIKKYIPSPHQYSALPQLSFVTQRGCPFNCSFCQVSSILGRKVRRHSVPRVIREIELMIEHHGIKGLYFQDSTFTNNREYTVTLLSEMLRRNINLKWMTNTRVDCVDEELLKLMRKSGCWQISFGIESANSESLQLLNKGKNISLEKTRQIIKTASELGIVTMGTFILGLPGENEQMVRKTIDFAKTLNLHSALFFLPIPYPNSLLWEQCKSAGGLREDASWNDYFGIDYKNPIYVNPDIGKKRMLELYNDAFFEFYTSPGVWIRNLKSIRSLNDIRRYAIAAYGFARRQLGI